jgi:cytoskeletal protein CcmA (bactofilin family)
VEGQVRSAGRVEIAATGRVTGEVHAGTLVMQEGAVVDGALHMAPPK